MGVLVLEVMTKLDHLPLGRVQITELPQLSPSHPIGGVFTILSPTSEKLGELQVSLVLEPLSETRDAGSSAPAPDASLDTAPAQGSSKPRFLPPSPQSKRTRVAAAGQEPADSSRATTPRGKDHLFFQENSKNVKDVSSASHHRLILPDEHLKANPLKQPESFPTSADPDAPPGTNTRVFSLHNPATKDLLSALLDQGNKLRDAMVVSAMKSSPDVEIELSEVPPFVKTDGFKAAAKSPNVLSSDFVPAPEDPHPFTSDITSQQLDLDSEERAIQLLLGSADLPPVRFWDQTGSLWDSLSIGSEVYDSELNDPHYDQSLLESLFYTAPKSDSSLSDFLSDEDVDPPKEMGKAKTVKKANSVNPQKDSSAFDQDQKVTEIKASCSPTRQLAPLDVGTEEVCVAALSVDQLALLGRIHLARVIIESLRIPPEGTQITPRKKGLMGKPPRPAPVNKCTFFVEYHFPVGASKNEKGQVSVTTEVIRIASSKITDGVVKFQQRFVFPLRFGGTMVEHWWSSDLAFKIYVRKSTQKKPVAVGSAVLQLRKVIQSELLTVSDEIPVEKEGGQMQVGPLKVSLELAADNKDFASTAARSAVAAQQIPTHAVRSPRLEFREPDRNGVNAESCVKFSSHEGLQKTGAASADVGWPPRAVSTSVAGNRLAQTSAPEDFGLLLHVLLMVPDGKDFIAERYGLHASCNVYLNCKLLSTEEATRSAVVWGTTQPAFNFSQVYQHRSGSFYTYYYPNVRDQMVAKGTLPLSRLCAMVTMQHREQIDIQTFNLPLVPRTDSSEEFHLRSSGLLDVSVRYRRFVKTAGTTAQAVSLAVQIHRAAGLQAAARAVAEKNPSLQYYAGVGVNAYVSVHLSFLPETERRNTQAVARTFCPEFEHHVEFPCNLIVQKSSGEASCLGELLQSASIVFSVYHQSVKSATDTLAARTSRDYLLGTVTIPTRDLLRRRSGITGWYPVTLAEEAMPSHRANIMQAVGGGLDLSVTFAHHGDRERVLEAAKLLGWNSEESPEDSLDESDEGDQGDNPVAVTISTPRVWLPVHCVLLAGQTHLNRSTHCYLRYKLYDQEATWTSLRRPKLSDDARNVTVSFKKPNEVTLRRSQGLIWFFREEKLEIQVWWAYGKENDAERPLDTDRLIGSAYVDLGALAERSRKALSVGGVYPLFRCNAADLAGAAVRVHVALSSTSAALTSRLHCAEEYSSSEDESTEKAPGPSQEVPENHCQNLDVLSSEIPSEKPQEGDEEFLENTVAVNILVERAMHLSLKGSPLTDREVTAPSSCVTFAVAGAAAPVTTSVIEDTDSPVWDFQQQARLSKELLLDPQQTLVFKVWHKAAETERVIGFASVDLSPLLSGFQLVCGWYNITDFSGQCRGQIKIAVSPLQNINNLKEEKQARVRTQPPNSSVKDSFPAFPGNVTSFSKQVSNTLSKEATQEPPVPSRIHSPKTHAPRHEEHMQNVRRFHESLQQAEGNAHRAAKVDALPLSSRASLLTALRKNLSELDEVQRYFSQKLTRSFPDFSYGDTPKPSREEQESDHQGLRSREVDPNGYHLLKTSSQLVSQVSSLISDLQTIAKTSKDSSGGHQDNSRKPSAARVPHQKGGKARTEVHQGQGESDSTNACSDTQLPCSFGRHILQELLDQAVPESESPLPADHIQRAEGAFALQPHSEEEYEEDVIEPRTLNEITTLTDKTSPWSSVLSEVELGAEQQPANVGPEDQGAADCLQKGNSRRSSSLSSVPQGDNRNVLTALSPCVIPRAEQSGPWAGTEGFKSLNGVTEKSEKELLRSARLSGVHQTVGGPAENGNCNWERTFNAKQIKRNAEFPAASEELLEFPGVIALTKPKTTAREKENGEVLGKGHQDEEKSGSNEIFAKSGSARTGSEGNVGGFSDGSHEDPPGESGKSEKPAIVLPDPVVPNFFLPPQQMEASMRMLSISSLPSTSGRGAALGGIPYRRPNRQRPALAPADLSEAEAQRIARIFSAQLSKNE
ncbi:C2 domain-containing protein 3 [Oxyura jamaicensis]|uniref:C2 domain-containing protein 3 n=1 Tax=Oxyura jamaicensis TaxID=8884 RepID=UPI0015A5FDB6|nr:C2 domain-containing protein 3 [Oxyura jamaicensis]